MALGGKRDDGPGDRRIKLRVQGPKPFRCRRGKFEAMKVMTKVVQGGAPVTKTYWYAPGVGLVKSMTDTGSVKSTTELLEYSAQK